MSEKLDQDWLDALKSDADNNSAKGNIHLIEASLVRSSFVRKNKEDEFNTTNNNLMRIYETASEQKLFRKEAQSFLSRASDTLYQLMSSRRGVSITASIMFILIAGNVVQFSTMSDQPNEIYRNSGVVTVSHSVLSPLETSDAVKNEFLKLNLRFSLHYFSNAKVEIQFRSSKELQALLKKYEISVPEDGLTSLLLSPR